MSRFDFGDSFDIKPAETVWILSPGPSLDFFDFKQIKPDDIVITCNSVLSVYNDADFQIGSDGAAVNGYAQYSKDKTFWLSKPGNAENLFSKGLNYINMEDLITRRFRGTGADSILLAYYFTTYQPSIKYINYVGLDFVEITGGGKTYYYSSKVEVLTHQKTSQLPKKWHTNPTLKVKHTNHSSYNAQRNTTNQILLNVPDFKEMLVSYSYMDFNESDKSNPAKKFNGSLLSKRRSY